MDVVSYDTLIGFILCTGTDTGMEEQGQLKSLLNCRLIFLGRELSFHSLYQFLTTMVGLQLPL